MFIPVLLKTVFMIRKNIIIQSLQRYWGIRLTSNTGSMLINKENVLFVPDLCLKTCSAVTKGTSWHDPYSLFYPYFFMMMGCDLWFFFSSCTLAACRVTPREMYLLILTLHYGWCSAHFHPMLGFCYLKVTFKRIWTLQVKLDLIQSFLEQAKSGQHRGYWENSLNISLSLSLPQTEKVWISLISWKKVRTKMRCSSIEKRFILIYYLIYSLKYA